MTPVFIAVSILQSSHSGNSPQDHPDCSIWSLNCYLDDVCKMGGDVTFIFPLSPQLTMVSKHAVSKHSAKGQSSHLVLSPFILFLTIGDPK